jgi:hypothetical protein
MLRRAISAATELTSRTAVFSHRIDGIAVGSQSLMYREYASKCPFDLVTKNALTIAIKNISTANRPKKIPIRT